MPRDNNISVANNDNFLGQWIYDANKKERISTSNMSQGDVVYYEADNLSNYRPDLNLFSSY